MIFKTLCLAPSIQKWAEINPHSKKVMQFTEALLSLTLLVSSIITLPYATSIVSYAPYLCWAGSGLGALNIFFDLILRLLTKDKILQPPPQENSENVKTSNVIDSSFALKISNPPQLIGPNVLKKGQTIPSMTYWNVNQLRYENWVDPISQEPCIFLETDVGKVFSEKTKALILEYKTSTRESYLDGLYIKGRDWVNPIFVDEKGRPYSRSTIRCYKYIKKVDQGTDWCLKGDLKNINEHQLLFYAPPQAF